MAKYRSFKAYGRYVSVGIEVALSIVLGLKGGQWLDARFGRGASWFTLVGLIVGAYAGFRAVYGAAKRMEQDVERDERDEREEYEEHRRTSEAPRPPNPDSFGEDHPSRPSPDGATPLDLPAPPPKTRHDDDE